MKVKDVIANCTEKDLIIIRDHGTELKATNIAPYKKAFAPYWERFVSVYWYEDNYKTVIIALD